jgi:hypothetical protein
MASRAVHRESGFSPREERLDESRELRRFGCYIGVLILLIGAAGWVAPR